MSDSVEYIELDLDTDTMSKLISISYKNQLTMSEVIEELLLDYMNYPTFIERIRF